MVPDSKFLSPLSNQRTDATGSFENRTRVLREIVAAFEVRGRASTAVRTYLAPIGSMAAGILSSRLNSPPTEELGADLIDCSSGGNAEHGKVPVGRVIKRRLRSRSSGSNS